MLELLPRPAVLFPAVFILGFVVYNVFRPIRGLPNIPLVGVRKDEWFPVTRARWRNALDFKAAVIEAQKTFPDEPCILPIAGMGDIILLPRSETQFVVDQPESVLSMHDQVCDALQIDYTCTDANLIYNPVHHKLITTTLTNQIGNLVPDVADETAWSVADVLGDDTEFHDINIFSSMCRIISSVTNRVFVGAPKCRDPELLRLGMAYARYVPVTAQFLRVLWAPVKPVVGFFVTLPIHRLTRRFAQIMRPEIDVRLAAFDARRRDPEAKSSDLPPRNDFLQWSIEQAKAAGDPYLWDPATLAGRVQLLNFAAIHTSSISITNAILDLLAAKPEYVDELRTEIETVLAEHGGAWNKRALARMEKLDSVLRESARMNSFITVGLRRHVMVKEGVVTPSGVRLPYGACVAVPSYVVLHDDEVYPDAEEFQPFRFSDQRQDESVEYVKRAGKAFATTDNNYLAFGHGRNACPGRFFAANELKLMLAHMLLHYDFEMKGSRPENKWMGTTMIPPMDATMRVRKRVASKI